MERVERCVLHQQRLLTVGRLERETALGFRPNSDGALHIPAEGEAGL